METTTTIRAYIINEVKEKVDKNLLPYLKISITDLELEISKCIGKCYSSTRMVLSTKLVNAKKHSHEIFEKIAILLGIEFSVSKGFPFNIDTSINEQQVFITQ